MNSWKVLANQRCCYLCRDHGMGPSPRLIQGLAALVLVVTVVGCGASFDTESVAKPPAPVVEFATASASSPASSVPEKAEAAPTEERTDALSNIASPAENREANTARGAGGSPAPGHALRFLQGGYVEIQNSQELLHPHQPFTVEAWVRFYPDTDGCWIAGNRLYGGEHPSLPRTTQAAGWDIRWINEQGRPKVSFGTWSGLANETTPKEYVWRHVAACGDGETITVYVDGKQGPSRLAKEFSYQISPINVALGSPYNPAANRGPRQSREGDVWVQDMRAFRVSSVPRYDGDFTPSSSLDQDANTVTLLDFSPGSGETIADLTGNGRDGRISGARWIELPDDHLAASNGPVALRLRSGQYVKVPADCRTTLGAAFTAEMWCRWDLAGKRMDWMGNLPHESADSGRWALRVSPAGDQAQLQVAFDGGQGQWRTTPGAAIPAKTEPWRHVALCGTSSEGVQVYLDGQLILEYKHGLKSRLRDPVGLFLGSPAGRHEEGMLDVRAFRLTPGWRYTNFVTPQGFNPPPLLVKHGSAGVVLGFSEPHARSIPNLTGSAGSAWITAGEWIDPESGERLATVSLPQQAEQLAATPRPAEARTATAELAAPRVAREPRDIRLPPSVDVGSPVAAPVRSVLSVYLPEAKTGAAPYVVMAKLTCEEVRHDLLAHEIIRQALLTAVRDEVGLLTRDEALGETADGEASPVARLVLQTSIAHGNLAQATVTRDGETGRPLWGGTIRLPNSPPRGYVNLVEQSGVWSQKEFPDLLRFVLRQTLPEGQRTVVETAPVGAPAQAGGAALPEEIEQRLWRMDFIDQFAAVRQLHQLAREQGVSPEKVEGLARGYANLGMLTEFHWSEAPKALKARGLIYAQRLAMDSAWRQQGLRRRAYAWAMTGLHELALDDLRQAGRTESSTSPAWERLIEAYCRFDAEAIHAEASTSPHAELASVLRFFVDEYPPATHLTLERGDETLFTARTCLRVADGMHGVRTLGNLHHLTAETPLRLVYSIQARLPDVPGLPAGLRALLAPAPLEPAAQARLVQGLRESGRAGVDAGELSWQALAQMIAETHFVHVWNRAMFMRFFWAVPTDDYLAAMQPLIDDHPHRMYIDLAEYDGARFGAAMGALLSGLHQAPLPIAAKARLADILSRRYAEDTGKILSGPKPPVDETHQDLVSLLVLSRREDREALGERLATVSSHSPATVVTRLRHGNPLLSNEEAKRIEQQHGRHPAVLEALVDKECTEFEDEKRLLKKWIAISPDHGAYVLLARRYKHQGDLEQWKQTYDEFLKQPSTGLEHASVRVEIARHYMDQQAWREALPYAEKAAESYAEWAMRAAVECYEGLGDLEKAGLWMYRLAERYGRVAEYQAWLEKHGFKQDEEPQQGPQPEETRFQRT